MALVITEESHLDHGLSPEVVAWLLEQFKDRSGFFIESFDLPPWAGKVESLLYGPVAGDDPVTESEVYYSRRGDRAGESRMVHRPARFTRQLTVIAGPRGSEPCVLYTAHGGGPAPREPWSVDAVVSRAAHAEAVSFWAVHALASDTTPCRWCGAPLPTHTAGFCPACAGGQ